MTRIRPPEYTQFPNVIIDELMPLMSDCELRVVIYAIRQTFGWHKEADAISISRFANGTGLSRQSVIRGLNLAKERGVIIELEETGRRGIKSYKLAVDEDMGEKPQENSDVQQNSELDGQDEQIEQPIQNFDTTDLSNNTTSQKIGLELVKKLDTQNIVKEKGLNTLSNGSLTEDDNTFFNSGDEQKNENPQSFKTSNSIVPPTISQIRNGQTVLTPTNQNTQIDNEDVIVVISKSKKKGSPWFPTFLDLIDVFGKTDIYNQKNTDSKVWSTYRAAAKAIYEFGDQKPTKELLELAHKIAKSKFTQFGPMAILKVLPDAITRMEDIDKMKSEALRDQAALREQNARDLSPTKFDQENDSKPVTNVDPFLQRMLDAKKKK